MADTDIGNIISAVTGLTDFFSGTTSARSYKYQRKLQKHAQEFAKWQMGNAHQMEVQDLENAGLNKVLSAGGSGASASVAGGGEVNAGPNGAEIANMLSNTALQASQAKNLDANTINETAKTNSEITKNNAEIISMAKQNGYTDEMIANAIEQRNVIIAEGQKAKSEKELIDAQTKIKQWEARHPILVNLVFPATTALVGAIAGGASGGIVGGFMGAANSAKQHQYRMSEKSIQMNSGGVDPRSLGIGI